MSSVVHRGRRVSLRRMPVILDVAIGHAPDDAAALAVAARTLRLSLVLTSDEHDAQRSRLARFLMDSMGRTRVPVVAGSEVPSGGDRWVCDGIVPDYIGPQAGSVLDAVEWVLRNERQMVNWIVLGPATNLAAVLQQRPELAGRLVVTWMGGALANSALGGASHNIRIDPASAVQVMRSGLDLSLVLADSVQSPEMFVDYSSGLYQALAGPGVAQWASVVRECYDRYLRLEYPNSVLEAPLTVLAGAGIGLVSFADRHFTIGEDGQMRLTPHGDCRALLSTSVDHAAYARGISEMFQKLSVPRAIDSPDPSLLNVLAPTAPSSAR
ncbi:nucleoside hydrolase [Nocardia sp. NPDC050710]|uniref:nucleoside hydrolase n=1 Tax=Nocardia sp. NPDC050710 TaxID=3157220 RepID=UPI0033F62BA0